MTANISLFLLNVIDIAISPFIKYTYGTTSPDSYVFPLKDSKAQ